MDTTQLEALAERGPVRRSEGRDRADPHDLAQATLEGDPLLSKDIRFFFEPNSADARRQRQGEPGLPRPIKRFLQVSPGSMVLLRGHVDNARVDEFRKQGGEELVKTMALKAMELSQATRQRRARLPC